jgi:hypothetical protein
MTEGRINRFFPKQMPVIQWYELSVIRIFMAMMEPEKDCPCGRGCLLFEDQERCLFRHQTLILDRQTKNHQKHG